MQVQSQLAGYQCLYFLDVLSQLGYCPCLPGIVPGRLNASAAKFGVGGFKSAHVIRLPAVQADCYFFHFFQRRVRIHFKGLILVFCQLVCFFD